MNKLEMRLVDLIQAANFVRYLLVDKENKEPVGKHLRALQEATRGLEVIWEEEKRFAKAMRLK